MTPDNDAMKALEWLNNKIAKLQRISDLGHGPMVELDMLKTIRTALQKSAQFDDDMRIAKDTVRSLFKQKGDVLDEKAKLKAQVDVLVNTLESAHNGLKWWRNEYPDRYSQADDEMDMQIYEAIQQFSAKEG